MILTGKEDLRVRKTVGTIRRTFEAMLGEMDFEKITVTALSDRAQISKKTFYAYYADLDALLRETQGEIARRFIERVKGLRFPADVGKAVREFFLFSAEQGTMYEKITCGGNYSYIRGQMIRNVMASTWSSPDGFAQEAALAMMQAATLEIYRLWVADGKTIPVEAVADLAATLVCRGTDGCLRPK